MSAALTIAFLVASIVCAVAMIVLLDRELKAELARRPANDNDHVTEDDVAEELRHVG